MTFTADSDGQAIAYKFPEALPDDLAQNYSIAGVLCMIPGTVGCIQAT